MRDDRETEDFEVDYKKPPKSRQFMKGVSGNPSGRKKKASDFGSKLLRELDQKLIINENGIRKVITKSEGIVKQLVNNSLSGNLPATRLLVPLHQQAVEKTRTATEFSVQSESDSRRYVRRGARCDH
jgi:hypothetical protein